KEVGDTFWETEQLLAASNFADAAARLSTRYTASQAIVDASSPAVPVSSEVIFDYLNTNGLPGPFVSALEAMGWSSEAIEALGPNLLKAGPEGYDPDEALEAAQFGPFFQGAVSMEELSQALRLRTEVVG